MSSDLFGFDNSFLYETFSPAQDHLFLETSQEIQDSSNFLIQVNNNEIASVLLSPSPRRTELKSSSLSELGDADYSVLEVKNEECRLGFDRFSTFSCYGSSFSSHAAHDETAARLLQRNYGHNYYQNQQSFSFKPHFDYVPESKNEFMGSPESSFSSGEMRSNGDVHKEKTSMQSPSMEEANFKVGRYSAEERREKIDRYRAKRTRRNFNKTIKYACRKTLADSRQRVRGRFARNDEVGEILEASLFQRCEDEDDFWIDGFMKKMTMGLGN